MIVRRSLDCAGPYEKYADGAVTDMPYNGMEAIGYTDGHGIWGHLQIPTMVLERSFQQLA